ncbi:hypothetical protein [Methylophaga sulfidovorans]|uniref:Uncharacterized protein n=1 Tax=Methylophaga sulfidovorans TaxID=45496 RepID=A0A1I4AEA4_9GAMM|nr:hypothetical protein [Methylophaga sulfidovorans]SFK54059.1 hypothetical protein SAMN04488079_11413 [Methylophaga sulfidovorans]
MAFKVRKNSWGQILESFGHRIKNGFKSPKFVGWAFLFLLIGGMGVWLPWAITKELSSQSLFTYSIAILGGLLIDSFLKDGNNL